ncbi:CBS domain-containing protein [Ectobacillus polymachus]|uniref:CBS domain-containing protein n=1 Tax=Ectobacillus polymachus TaxID=1508806 RepID=UPI003A86019F
MSTNIAYCTPVDNVFEAATKMKQEDVGIIPVVNNNRLMGLVTDRDIVLRGIAEKHPGSESITSVMSTDIVSVSPDDPVEKAAELMSRYQIRRLPVVEHNELVGMVSLGDLAVEQFTDDQAQFALSEISEDHHQG